ncbi:MAG: transposase [Verrucomicrobiota bacterium]|nr:transposase [Verrucomicrobiota bacterium]
MNTPLQLLDRFWDLTDQWACVFSQQRIHQKMQRHAAGLILTMGRTCISRILTTLHLDQIDWSAEYRLFSRSRWNPQDAFKPVLHAMKDYGCDGDGPIVIAGDQTHIKRSGRKVAGTHTMRDPVSSQAYHVNLIRGVSFLHLGVLAYPKGYASAPASVQDVLPSPRCLPVHFSRAPVLKKPARKASETEIALHKQLQKTRPVMQSTLAAMKDVRERLDQCGHKQRRIHFVFDGSFCNRTVMEKPMERIDITCRCRKNASFRLRDPQGKGNRFYLPGTLTADQIRTDHENYPWSESRIRFGNAVITIRYKEVHGIYWHRAAGRRPLRLFIVAEPPHADRSSTKRKHPCFGSGSAFLLSTNHNDSACKIIQDAFDRWQIEVAHRELKSVLGVGHSQVRHIQSVERHPAFAAACYSLLHLAGLQTYGWTRTAECGPLPKWRANAARPSCLDLVRVLRKQLHDRSSTNNRCDLPLACPIQTIAAAAA